MSHRLRIPSGFRGLIAADGQSLACGFNQVLHVALPSGVVTPIQVGGEASPCGPPTNNVIPISKYITQSARKLLNWPIQPDVYQMPGYMPTRAAWPGHVVSSAGGVHFIDGQPVPYNSEQSNIEDNDGTHFIYKPWNAGSPLVIRSLWAPGYAEAARINEPITNSTIFTDAFSPWVFANLNGRSRIYQGGQLFHEFGAGEYRGCLMLGPGENWAARVGQFHDGKPFVILNPFSDLSGPGIILRDFWWKEMDAVWKPAEHRWVLCGYIDGSGDLDIDTDIDPATPREVLDFSNSAGTTPQPPIEPPVVTPPTGRVIEITGPLNRGDVIRIV